MGISERITSIRKSKGITQTSIAERLEMDRGNYSKLEKRGEKMTVEQLQSIADALEVSVVELMGIEVKPVDTGGKERIKELEDRIRDKDFKLKAFERESYILKALIFYSLHDGLGLHNRLKVSDCVQFINKHTWLFPLLSGIPFNNIQIHEPDWRRYWHKAISTCVNQVHNKMSKQDQEGTEGIFEDLLLSETSFSLTSKRPDRMSIDEMLEWENDPANEVERISFYTYLSSKDEKETN